MDEYITKEVVIQAFEWGDVDVFEDCGDGYISGFSREAIKNIINSIPAADVAPVVHGRWEKQNGLYSCSECGKTCPYDVQADVIEYWACNYCPKCGAKMDMRDTINNNANKEID